MTGMGILEFADKLNLVMPVVMKEFARRQVNELYKGKITLPQFLILEFLSREGGSKMTILAHFMGVSTAAMTGIVERLVRDSYAARGAEPDDRRIINVRLTSKGSDLVAKINEQRRKMIINIFSKISEADRKDYLRILAQIKDILTQESVHTK